MSSNHRFIRWVLAVAAMVAGMLLGAGSTQATAGPGYTAAPKSAAFANFVTLPGRSRTAINAAVTNPCWADPSLCSGGSSEPPSKKPSRTPSGPRHYPPQPYFHIPHIQPIQPMPVPPVCQATVPNLINLTEAQARQAVAAMRLALVSNHPSNNRIMSQTPFAGTRVLCGWTIAVTVDQPPPPPVEIPSPDPPPAIVVPPPPIVVPPAVPVSRIDPMPWFWPLIIALLVLSAALLLGLLLLLAVQARKGPKWVHAHVRAVAAATPGPGVEVMESRTERSVPTCAVRLQPHADSGLQVLEEVSQ
jgi:hypothetical protein